MGERKRGKAMTAAPQPPKRIYLQWHDPDSQDGNVFVTWSEDKQNDDDVEYWSSAELDNVRRSRDSIIKWMEERNEALRREMRTFARYLAENSNDFPNSETVKNFALRWQK